MLMLLLELPYGSSAPIGSHISQTLLFCSVFSANKASKDPMYQDSLSAEIASLQFSLHI